MTIVFILCLFFLGAVFGSFGGVIIERGQGGYMHSRWKSIFGGRSHCPGCKGKNTDGLLTRWKLIPIVGWFIQKGECRDCGEEIPQWYVILEMIMGLVFVTTGLLVLGAGSDSLFALLNTAQGAGALIFWLLVNWLLVLLIVADFFYFELNVYVWILLLFTILVYLGVIGAIVPGLIGGAVLGCVFLLIYLGAKRYAQKKFGPGSEGVGLGDVLLAVAIGMLYPFVAGSVEGVVGGVVGGIESGITGLAQQIVTVQLLFLYLIVSSGLGIFYRIGQIIFASEASRDKQIEHLDDVSDFHMPFIPAMIVAAWIMLLWGSDIVAVLV